MIVGFPLLMCASYTGSEPSETDAANRQITSGSACGIIMGALSILLPLRTSHRSFGAWGSIL